MRLRLLLCFVILIGLVGTSSGYVDLVQTCCQKFPCDGRMGFFYAMQSSLFLSSDSPNESDFDTSMFRFLSIAESAETGDKSNLLSRLINETNLFAIVGDNGYAFPQHLIDFSDETLIFAPMYGNVELRDKSRTNIVNIRGSYYDEVGALLSRLNEFGSICLLYENGTIGDAINEAWGYFNYTNKSGSYTPIDSADGSFSYIDTSQQFSNCSSIVIALDEKTIFNFVSSLHRLYDGRDSPNKIYAFTSFTDPVFILPLLKGANISQDQLFFSTVFPPGKEAVVREAIQLYFPQRNFTYYAEEGYYASMLFLQVYEEAYKRTGGHVTQQSFTDALYDKGAWDVGIPLVFSKGKSNQGMMHTFVCRVGDDWELSTRDVFVVDVQHNGRYPDSSGKVLFTIVVVVVSVVGLLVSFGLFIYQFCLRQRLKILDELSPFFNSCRKNVLNSYHSIPTFDKSELQMNEDTDILGSGGSATVYKAVWHNTVVAVKKIHLNDEMQSDKEHAKMVQEFVKEMNLMAQLSHPSIVQFFGVADGQLVVMEYMEHGSLRDVVLSEEDKPSEIELIRLLLMASRGMQYLHSRKVLHLDLNPRNILVSGPPHQLRAKLVDFGLSGIQLTSAGKKAAGATVLFASPEAILGHPCTFKSDVYSFGMTIWFTISGEEPFSHLRPMTAQGKIVNGERPEPVSNAAMQIIISKCWPQEQRKRTSFRKITTELRDYLEGCDRPIK